MLTAIQAMTHTDDVPYLEYVRNISRNNPIAAKVKLADLWHNSDLSRIDCPTEKDLERVKNTLWQFKFC